MSTPDNLTVRLNFDVSPALAEELRTLAKAAKWTLAATVRNLIEEALAARKHANPKVRQADETMATEG